MNAIAYIDGHNLYYGLSKGTSWKWLDLWAFAHALLKPDIEPSFVKYFTAPIKTFPHDQSAIDRQRIYLQALTAQTKVEIVPGFYNKNKTLAPSADERCQSCDISNNGLVPIYKLEGKRSDVNLAVSMVTDAATNSADCFLLITGDSDQVGAIESVRHRFGKQVTVFNPHVAESRRLHWTATYYKNIPRDLPSRCQPPENTSAGTYGHVLHRPEAWR